MIVAAIVGGICAVCGAFIGKAIYNSKKAPKEFKCVAKKPSCMDTKLSSWWNYKRICREEKELIDHVNKSTITFVFTPDELAEMKEFDIDKLDRWSQAYIMANSVSFPEASNLVYKWACEVYRRCRVICRLLHVSRKNAIIKFEVERLTIKGLVIYDKAQK